MKTYKELIAEDSEPDYWPAPKPDEYRDYSQNELKALLKKHKEGFKKASEQMKSIEANLGNKKSFEYHKAHIAAIQKRIR